MKHVFLIKPSPVQSKSDSLIKNIERVMEGRDYEIYFSQYKDHVKEIIKNYLEKTRFYSIGGDGFFQPGHPKPRAYRPRSRLPAIWDGQ